MAGLLPYYTGTSLVIYHAGASLLYRHIFGYLSCRCFLIIQAHLWLFITISHRNTGSLKQIAFLLEVTTKIFSLYPRHLCRGVYSFRLSVCMFVRSFVRSFVLPSVAWNLRQIFALKFLKWCISQQLLIRKLHIWTIVILEGWHSLHDHGPQGPCPG